MVKPHREPPVPIRLTEVHYPSEDPAPAPVEPPPPPKVVAPPLPGPTSPATGGRRQIFAPPLSSEAPVDPPVDRPAVDPMPFARFQPIPMRPRDVAVPEEAAAARREVLFEQNRTPASYARSAAVLARRMRAENLIAVHRGILAVRDYVEAATTPGHEPLLQQRLDQLLLSHPGWGPRRAKRILQRLLLLIGDQRPHAELTVRWLLDPRCGGRRYFAFLETLGEFDQAFAPTGFPYAGLGSKTQTTSRPGPLAPYHVDALVDPDRFPDPFYGHMFASGAVLTWTTSATARAMGALSEGGGRGRALPRPLAIAPEEAAQLIASQPPRFKELLTMLAVLHSWGTVSGRQMRGLTGIRSLSSARHPLIAAAFAAGVIDLALPADSRESSLLSEDVIYRPGKAEIFDRIVAPYLTAYERLAVLGGVDWRGPDWFDRHNLLAVELGERIADAVAVSAVLGPRFSSVDQLVYGRVRRSMIESPNKSGDLTVLLSSGVRLVVEVTATLNDKFDAKAAAWAEVLRATSLEHSGIVVLFVDARPPGQCGNGDLERRLTKILDRFVWKGIYRDRINVVKWTDWFPQPGEADAAFYSLECRGWSAEGAWVPVKLRDMSFTPAGWDSTAALSSAAVMLQTPAAQRRRLNPPDAREFLQRATGLPQVPVPAPQRPERAKGHPLGAAKGAAGAAGLPGRLAWPDTTVAQSTAARSANSRGRTSRRATRFLPTVPLE